MESTNPKLAVISTPGAEASSTQVSPEEKTVLAGPTA
jgi:hypothetical protein